MRGFAMVVCHHFKGAFLLENAYIYLAEDLYYY